MPVPSFSVGEVLTAGAMNQVGSWLIDEGSFTSVATKEIEDVFSADFMNYRLVLSNITISNYSTLFVKLGTGGSISSQSYYLGGWYVSWAAASGALALNNTNDGWYFCNSQSNGEAVGEMTIYRPFLADNTGMTCQSIDGGVGAWFTGGRHQENTSYSGITLLCGANTMSGSYQVYGYNS